MKSLISAVLSVCTCLVANSAAFAADDTEQEMMQWVSQGRQRDVAGMVAKIKQIQVESQSGQLEKAITDCEGLITNLRRTHECLLQAQAILLRGEQTNPSLKRLEPATSTLLQQSKEVFSRLCQLQAMCYEASAIPARAIPVLLQQLDTDMFKGEVQKHEGQANLVKLYSGLNDFENAEKFLPLAKACNTAYISMACALYYERKGDLAQARRELEAMPPPLPGASNGLDKARANMQLAVVLAKIGDKQGALKKLAETNAIYASLPPEEHRQQFSNEGKLEYFLGEYPKALTSLTKAIENGPLDRESINEVHLLRAATYQRLGDKESALEDVKAVESELDAMPFLRPLYLQAKGMTSTTPVQAKLGQRYALLVGVSEFQDSTIPQLRFAARDAQEMANLLVTRWNVPKQNVKVLTNQQATRENIMEALADSFFPHTKPEDAVILFFSSHGTPAYRDIAAANYAVCFDTKKSRLYPTALDLQELTMILSRVPAQRRLIILDTCYSGGAGLDPLQGRGGTPLTTVYPTQMVTGAQQLVLTSSSPSQKSWESKRYSNGVFTHHLLDFLAQTSDRDLPSQFASISAKTNKEVQADDNAQQTPMMSGQWKATELFSGVH